MKHLLSYFMLAVCLLGCSSPHVPTPAGGAIADQDSPTATSADKAVDEPKTATASRDGGSELASTETQSDNSPRGPAQPSDRQTANGGDSRPLVEDEIVDISFDDLNCNMQVDVVFRPFMLTERAKELDGRRVRVSGVMLPHTQQEGIREFVLLRNAECKFGPGGQADHLIQVKLKQGVTADYRGDRPVEVVGRLKINPFNGPGGITYCIYDLENGESVTWKWR